jgi:hypothetical protein
VLRLIAYVIVFAFTCAGVVLLVAGDGGTRAFGLLLAVMGLAWLVIGGMRRRGII